MQASVGLSRAPWTHSRAKTRHANVHINLGRPVNIRDKKYTSNELDAPVACPSTASHGIRLGGEESDGDNMLVAPPWLRLVAIAISTSFVAILELLFCKRPPLFWTPVSALMAVMFWRTGLRDATRSNAPPRAPDRFFMLAFFLLVVFLELSVLKQLVYSPWLCALVFMVVSPSNRAMDDRENVLIREARARTDRENSNRIPVTPKESSAWVGRLLSCYWIPFVEPLVLRTAILPLQEQLEAVAPPGWTLGLESFTVGDVSPTLTGWQVFNNALTGEVEAVTADLEYESTSFSMTVNGSGPFVGTFTGTLKGLSMKGQLQLIPIKEARVLLFSFTERPELDVKLGIRGPFIGKQAIPQFAFLRNAITESIQKDFVEPNRGMIPLEYDEVYGRPLASVINVTVVQVTGLSSSDKGKNKSQKSEKDAEDMRDGISIELDQPVRSSALRDPTDVEIGTNGATQVPRTPSSSSRCTTGIKVTVSLPELQLFRHTGQHPVSKDGHATVNSKLNLQVLAESTNVVITVHDERGRELGEASMKAAHLPDGATAFWGTGTDGRAIATRWTEGMKPWRGTIPILGTKEAAVEVEFSMAPWQYSLDVATPQAFRNSLRSIVAVQVLEGRNLAAKDFGGMSDPYVRITYNKRNATTSPVFVCLDPVFGETFIFQENRSVLSRRLRLEVFDQDIVTADDPCGYATLNLDLLAQGQVTEQWCQLRGESRGEVRVKLLVLPGGIEDEAVQREAKKILDANETMYSSDIVEVTIVRAENLPSSMKGKLCNAVVESGKILQATGRSPVQRSRRHVHWDHTMRFRAQQVEGKPLKISIKHGSANDMILRGKTLGSASINPEFLAQALSNLRESGTKETAVPPTNGRPKSISPARLLYGDLAKPDSRTPKGTKTTVAQLQDAGNTEKCKKTQTVEQWLPIVGAGDARVLIKIQGSLGLNARISENMVGDFLNKMSGTKLPSLMDHDDDDKEEKKKVRSFDMGTWMQKQVQSIAKNMFD